MFVDGNDKHFLTEISDVLVSEIMSVLIEKLNEPRKRRVYRKQILQVFDSYELYKYKDLIGEDVSIGYNEDGTFFLYREFEEIVEMSVKERNAYFNRNCFLLFSPVMKTNGYEIRSFSTIIMRDPTSGWINDFVPVVESRDLPALKKHLQIRFKKKLSTDTGGTNK